MFEAGRPLYRLVSFLKETVDTAHDDMLYLKRIKTF